MTNAIPLIQLAARQAGVELSGGEAAALCALTGILVHAAHLGVNGWRRVGGWDGFKAFLRSGK